MEDTQVNPQKEHALELFIGNLLRWCVVVVVIVVVVGAVLYVPQHTSVLPDYRAFRGEPDALRSVSGVIGLVTNVDPVGIIQLGLLLLILTPILRVALSAVAFVVEKDRLYVLMTLIVLTLLLYSLFAG